ncbi:MAG: hypothetical protein R2737_15540 [Candidatus Nanopelagicales bacterium]
MTTPRTRILAAVCATTACLTLGLATLAPAAQAAPAATAGAASASTGSSAHDEGAAALERLRAAGMLAEAPEAANSRAYGLAVKFGLMFFKGLGTGAGHMSFELLAQELGFGHSDQELVAALSDIGASVEQLNSDVRALAAQVEALLDGQDRANFYDSYSQAGQAASRLSVAMASVRSWIERGATPSASHVSDLQTVIRTSVADLSFQLVNPTTGTIPLMMRAAEPSRVSADLPSYWRTIDTAREDYRAVLAQGLATLDLLQRWDTTGTVAADLETLSDVSADTVLRMYEYGLAADAADHPYVHTRGSQWVMGPWAAVEFNGDLWRAGWRQMHSTTGWLDPFVQEMVREYRPALHGGATLEQYLRDRGIPTRYVHPETIETQVTQRPNGKPYQNDVVHAERVRVTDIRGNEQVTEWRNLGGERVAYVVIQKCGWSPGQTVCTWEPFGADAPAQADALAASERQQWRVSMDERDVRWMSLGYLSEAHSRLLRAYRPTSTALGIAADMDPTRIRAAAFGTA